MSFSHDLLLLISCVVELSGSDLDVRVKSILFEQDSTSSVMGNVKVLRLALEVFDRFLMGNYVPFACNMLFNGTFSDSRC